MERNVAGKGRKSQYWQHNIDGWHRRGQTQKANCRANSLALATFCGFPYSLHNSSQLGRQNGFYKVEVTKGQSVPGQHAKRRRYDG